MDATYQKISSLIKSQFPEFIRDEGPNFVAFLKHYYEHQEQSGEAGAAMRQLADNQDIDLCADALLEYFRRELMLNIPASSLADKRLVAKHIRDFYRARGSADAYRFLFRILYGKEVNFYYPGEDILRCSDGRWTIETIMRVGIPIVGQVSKMEGRFITGKTSGARGRIETITGQIISGLALHEFTLSSVNGTFIDGEIVTDNEGNSATINNIVGPLSNIAIQRGGAFHRNADTLEITGAGSTVANGNVTATTDMMAATFRIVKGGRGYRTTPYPSITIGSSSGKGASFTISGLANTENIYLNSDIINPMRNVILSTGPTFVSAGANTSTISANLASANISSVLSAAFALTAVTVGKIVEITLIDPGSGYNRNIANGLPTITVTDQDIADLMLPDGVGGIKGKGAIIVANNAPGALTGLAVNNRGNDYNRNIVATIRNKSLGAGYVYDSSTDAQTGQIVKTKRQASYAANGTPQPIGVIQGVGRYTGTPGFLSWNNKLQDNYYYQQFSYVLMSPVLIDTYRAAVKQLLHPAGTKLFSILLMGNAINVDTAASTDTFTVKITSTVNFPTITADAIIVQSNNSQEPIDTSDLELTIGANTDLVKLWGRVTGTINISDFALISSRSSQTVGAWAPLPIQYFMQPNTILYGTGTQFSTQLAVAQTIIIQALSESTANGLYTIQTIASNTAAEFAAPYAGNQLANGYVYR